MRLRPLSLFVILLAVGSSGCGLIRTGTSVVTHRTWEALEDCAEKQRNDKWAQQAWKEATAACGEGAFSRHYAKGFKEGFASFLYRGGNGEPPPVAPFEYHKLQYQTPQGYQATLDWFAGYRHGAAYARDGGFRELVTGPSALRTAAPAPAAPVEPALSGPPIAPGPVAPLPPPVQAAPPAQTPPPPQAQAGPKQWIVTVDFTPWKPKQ